MRTLVPYALAVIVACVAEEPAARPADSPSAQRAAPGDTPAADSAARAAARPVFEIDLWPGEGRPVIEAVATRLTLRQQPYADAAVAHELLVARGQRLSFDSARYQTLAPGSVRVLAPARVQGRMLGAVTHLTNDAYFVANRFPSGAVEVDTTTRLEYLQYRAEGTCFVRVGAEVIDAQECPAHEGEAFSLEREPETRWWVRVVGPEARSGWLVVVDGVARVADRTF
jgi:hypothetical protein